MINPLLVTSTIILKSLFKFLKKRNSSLCLLFQTVTKRLLIVFTRCPCSYERERQRQREIPDLVSRDWGWVQWLFCCYAVATTSPFTTSIQLFSLYVSRLGLGFCFFVCGFFFFFFWSLALMEWQISFVLYFWKAGLFVFGKI